jgi:hypothetical protein
MINFNKLIPPIVLLILDFHHNLFPMTIVLHNLEIMLLKFYDSLHDAGG